MSYNGGLSSSCGSSRGYGRGHIMVAWSHHRVVVASSGSCHCGPYQRMPAPEIQMEKNCQKAVRSGTNGALIRTLYVCPVPCKRIDVHVFHVSLSFNIFLVYVHPVQIEPPLTRRDLLSNCATRIRARRHPPMPRPAPRRERHGERARELLE